MGYDQHHPAPQAGNIGHLFALFDSLPNTFRSLLGRDRQHRFGCVRQVEHLGLDHAGFNGDDIYAVTR